MSAKAAAATFDLPAALLGAFTTNGRINACMIRNVPASSTFVR